MTVGVQLEQIGHAHAQASLLIILGLVGEYPCQ